MDITYEINSVSAVWYQTSVIYFKTIKEPKDINSEQASLVVVFNLTSVTIDSCTFTRVNTLCCISKFNDFKSVHIKYGTFLLPTDNKICTIQNTFINIP